MKIAAAILAAGGSSRLPAPKQLLQLGGETLVRRAARAALSSGATPVIVVTGDAASAVELELKELPVVTVRNDQWRSGIASSVRAAVRACGDADALMILLCDQPKINSEEVNILMNAFEQGGRPIAAAAYGGSLGVPAIFHRSVWPELAQLSGDRGAKAIIFSDEERVTVVTMEAAAVDVDTPEDAIRIGANRGGPPDRR